MALPDWARADILEFAGATPMADAQLKMMIDKVSARLSERRGAIAGSV